MQHSNTSLYSDEIKNGIEWLFKIQEKEYFGWSWIKHISPNLQNTSEVILTMSKNIHHLDKKQKEYLRKSVEYWLLEADFHAHLSREWIWALMALNEYTESGQVSELSVGEEELKELKNTMISRILSLQNSNGGWPDSMKDVSSLGRTGLALKALSKEKGRTDVNEALKRGAEFIINNQNDDGGFGDVRKADLDTDNQKKILELAYGDVKAQYVSNPASTAYCVMGLIAVSIHKYQKQIGVATQYLIDTQSEDGHWDVFYEVGVKNDNLFTFRHFGTAWVLQCFLDNENVNKRADYVLKGMHYLLQLQDNVFGGWKSSPDSDTYTWATCNALCVMAEYKQHHDSMRAETFYKLIYDINSKTTAVETILHGKKRLEFLATVFYEAFVITFATLLVIIFYSDLSFADLGLKIILMAMPLFVLFPLLLNLNSRKKLNLLEMIIFVLLVEIFALLMLNLM